MSILGMNARRYTIIEPAEKALVTLTIRDEV